MSEFKEFFDALQQSIVNDEFVKLTVSKPHRKNEGLLNVYVRLFVIDGKETFEFKYRHATENIYKKFSLIDARLELEKLLLETFRAGTLFTLSYDLLVMVSKKKQVSCRDTAPSFKNKLPEISQESKESEDFKEL
ncbi:MAG: hypothetical protein ACJAYY_002391 [Paraglaciecola sp.]|jgi:hypothetical protein|uniref:hypothetical protein n=1 Tax=Polaribacter sp. TaxID=1920175 RepID=UPI003AE09A8C